MSIGIIGAGNIGQAFARTLARAGINATISNSRGPDSLKELIGSLGPSIRAGTREQAASADSLVDPHALDYFVALAQELTVRG